VIWWYLSAFVLIAILIDAVLSRQYLEDEDQE
jgi:hypothetical protein